MTKSTNSTLNNIYTGLSIHNEFIAFWRSGEHSISIFIPDNFHDQHRTVDISEWDEQRKQYEIRENNFNIYEDIVNAAWHYIGYTNPLDRNSVKKSKFKLGTFYRRIWRGIFDKTSLKTYNPINPSYYGNIYNQSIVAASSLFDYLIEIFRNIEPNHDNLPAFGHKNRELLILACTEIEAGWRGVLDNNIKDKKKKYTTIDYFKLNKPLQLSKWSVSLNDYPNLGIFRPFDSWNEESPTTSLRWYDAYNKVKHDREHEFKQASLLNLLNAMAALHIIQVAQWGPEIYSRWHGNQFSPFSISDYPIYNHYELYIPNINENDQFIYDLYFSD